MLKPYIRQLKSQDAAERRQAIKALARLRNPAAVPILETVANSDPDPALRELAQKAIQFIEANADPNAARSVAAPSALPALPEIPAAPSAPSPKPERTHISPRDRDNARAYANTAFSYYQANDRARAVEWLGKALSLDPNLQEDSFVEGLVQNVMHMSVTEALPILTHPDRRKAYIAQIGGKQALPTEHVPQDATWDNVLIDFGLYGLVVLIGQFAMLYFAMDLYREMILRSPELSNSPGVDALLNMDVRGMALTSLLGSVYAIVVVVLQGIFVHLAATFILGGKGTLAYLYRKIVPIQTGYLLITGAAMVLLSLLMPPITALSLLNVVNFVIGLAVLYLLVQAIAKVYNFGAWSGCGAIVLGGILFVAVLFCGFYLLVTVLVMLLGGA